MTGLPYFNFPAFHRAQGILEAWGYKVWSPARHDLELGFKPNRAGTIDQLPPGFRERAMRWDIARVLDADIVVVLNGWEDSPGAQVEVSVARAIGTPVIPLTEMGPCG